MDVQDPCGEMDSASSDASQDSNIKVEEVSDAEEEEDGPMPVSFLKIKMEPEVRCLNICEPETAVCC
jgi:hypothetical protein